MIQAAATLVEPAPSALDGSPASQDTRHTTFHTQKLLHRKRNANCSLETPHFGRTQPGKFRISMDNYCVGYQDEAGKRVSRFNGLLAEVLASETRLPQSATISDAV